MYISKGDAYVLYTYIHKSQRNKAITLYVNVRCKLYLMVSTTVAVMTMMNRGRYLRK